jgi:orotidine-5'-phosphate decarboxylase
LIERKLSDVVEHYATNALTSGVHGVICSVWESKQIKEKISNNLLTVTPGIRNEKSSDDQHRVATLHEAHLNKVDYIVVGRPITRDKHPQQVYNEYTKLFSGV